MDPARVLRQARRRAGLTQRELAARAGVPQSRIARIESGAVVPRVDTFDRLLEACGEGLESVPRPGRGLDRTVARKLLGLSPDARARAATRANRTNMEVLRRVRKRSVRTG
ncbi:MAG: helix-turn-helix domain-containing protein [Actinomycetota bacterium]